MIKDYKINSEVRVIYFLIQAVSSLFILMFGVVFWYFERYKFLIRIALLLKVGIAPLHFWYIQIIRRIKWINFLLLRTIQKVAPLVLLIVNSVDLFKEEIYLVILIRRVTRSLGGLYTLSLRELLAYSSINHIAWVLVPLVNLNLFWLTYLMIYYLLLGLVVSTIIIFNIYHLNQLTSPKISWGLKVTLIIRIISLGGLPPLVGFIPKWGVILQIIEEINFLCLRVLIFSNVVRLYFYIRARSSVLLINSKDRILFFTSTRAFFGSVVIFVNFIGFLMYPVFIIRF